MKRSAVNDSAPPKRFLTPESFTAFTRDDSISVDRSSHEGLAAEQFKVTPSTYNPRPTSAGLQRNQAFASLRLARQLIAQGAIADALIHARTAAETGLEAAQCYLGQMHRLGLGVDQQEAERWLRAAAATQHAEAQFELALLLYDPGSRLPSPEALHWLSSAAAQQFAPAEYELGAYYERERGGNDLLRAASLYRSAAMRGHTDAQFSLGTLHYGGFGVEKDIALTVRWYRQAAEAGHLAAQYELARLYYDGADISGNFREAARLFGMAAAQGDQRSLYRLGWMYHHGEGVPLDLADAVSFYRRAADAGSGRACLQLGIIFFSIGGCVSAASESESRRWLRAAMGFGSGRAYEALATMCEETDKQMCELLRHLGCVRTGQLPPRLRVRGSTMLFPVPL